MGLYGSGVVGAFWRTPKRDMGLDMSARPIWVSCWTKGPLPSGEALALAFFADVTANKAAVGLYFNGVSGGTSYYALEYNDAMVYQQAAINRPETGQWHFVVGQYTSATYRIISIDNTVSVADAGSSSPPQTLNSFQIGTCPTDVRLTADRLIAEVTFGRGNLTAAQMTALYAGQTPMVVLPSQVLGYFPLRGDLSDSGPLRTGLTRVGNPATIFGEHPPVALPPKRRIIARSVVAPPPTVRPRISMVA